MLTLLLLHSRDCVQGDGLRFPPDTYNPQYSWGECPECQYWPTTVQENQGLKACVFDNTADPNEQEPYVLSARHANAPPCPECIIV